MKVFRRCVVWLVLLGGANGLAQQAALPHKLEFDVASVRRNVDDGKPQSNIALGPGDVWGPSGGVLSAKNFTLLQYLVFAYKLADYQQAALREKLPGWVVSDRYNIEARTADRDVTKDQMRERMRSLLADRFALAVHYESRVVAVYALEQAKAGATGPKLRQHPKDESCPDFSLMTKTADGKPTTHLPDAGDDGFPMFCGGIVGMPASAQDRYSFGARDIEMSVIAKALSSWGNLGRPVVDQTRLAGRWDFVLDYTPEPRPAYATVDSEGPTFQQALQRQLGLKLQSQKAPVEFLVVDRVEHVKEN
ncbi:MAG TPA: TIGR03435 family protein [Acidobacteriaceae bacterium]|nr:TIGR03435 family protein [Acidobacteriaceae bacterium]